MISSKSPGQLRDPCAARYSDVFRGVLVREGIQVIRLPRRSPNLNAFAKPFVRSVKEECRRRHHASTGMG
jgi:hypothetical protein